MNFLGLAAVLSAIGMYALARYVRHAKTAEAVSSVTSLAGGRGRVLQRLGRDAADGRRAERRPRHAPLPAELARTGPRRTRSRVRGKRYQSNLADWSASPWRELRFSIVQPQCYQYSFEAEGAGATAKALVIAEGDLDGDGMRSTYSLEVTPDEGLSRRSRRR